jgi:hypothetical protein
MSITALPLTPQFMNDPSGSSVAIAFDGGDPTLGGVSGGKALAAGNEDELGRMVLSGRVERAHLNVANTGPTNAFTALRIQSQAHPNANFEDLLTSTQLAAGTAIVDLLVAVSANSTTLAVGADANIIFLPNSAYAIRVLATSASGSKGTARMMCKGN